jgi:hypothetical protein
MKVLALEQEMPNVQSNSVRPPLAGALLFEDRQAIADARLGQNQAG